MIRKLDSSVIDDLLILWLMKWTTAVGLWDRWFVWSDEHQWLDVVCYNVNMMHCHLVRSLHSLEWQHGMMVDLESRRWEYVLSGILCSGGTDVLSSQLGRTGWNQKLSSWVLGKTDIFGDEHVVAWRSDRMYRSPGVAKWFARWDTISRGNGTARYL